MRTIVRTIVRMAACNMASIMMPACNMADMRVWLRKPDLIACNKARDNEIKILTAG